MIGDDIRRIFDPMEIVHSASLRQSWQNICNELAKLSDVAHAAAELLARVQEERGKDVLEKDPQTDFEADAQRLNCILSILSSKRIP